MSVLICSRVNNKFVYIDQRRTYSKLSLQGHENRNVASETILPHCIVGDDGERVIVGRSKNTTTMMLVFMTSRLDE